MTERRIVVPSTRSDNIDPDLHKLVRDCWKVIEGVRFDATALPLDELTFHAHLDGVELIVDMRVPDRDVTDEVKWIHVWRTLVCPWGPLQMNGPEYLVRWMRETIANTLSHEVDESISLGGVRVFDPHRPLLGETR